MNNGLNCEFGLYVLYNSTMPKDKLVLGLEFLKMYDLSMNFGQQQLGFHGYRTPAPKDSNNDGNNDGKTGGKSTGIIIGIVAAVLILIILGAVMMKLKRSKLQ
jgi:hypothetical protein